MYTAQCLPFVGYKFTNPISDSNETSLKETPKSLKNKNVRTGYILTFDVALIFSFFTNKILELHHLLLLLVTNMKSFKTLIVLGKLSNKLLS